MIYLLYFLKTSIIHVFSLHHLQAVGERLANYQPSIMQLHQAVDRLRALGQNTEAEDIQRLTSQYDLLVDQVKQHTHKASLAVSTHVS